MAGLTEAQQHLMRATAGALLLVLSCSSARANTAPEERRVMEQCVAYQAQRFGLDPTLMRAIAVVESNFNPLAVSPAGAVGLMQVNRTWLPTLAKFGIYERDLYDPCTSAEVGAWILSQLFVTRGASWVAVGAYNAACTVLKGDDCTKARASYAWKVFHAQMSAAPVGAAQLPSELSRRSGTVVALSTLLPRDITTPTAPTRDDAPPAAAPTLAPAPAATFTADEEDDDQ